MASNRSTEGTAATSDDPVARAVALGPLIDSLADEAEAIRRIPEPVINGLVEAGLYRLLLPKKFNGAQVEPVTFFRVIEEIASHDASTAWCLCQGNGCTMSSVYMDPEGARQIWGDDPRGVVAWGPGKSLATPVDGGFKLTAHCHFGSGSRHATYLGSHAQIIGPDGEPQRDDDGNVILRTMLFPAEKAEMVDVWDVIGLRATGSDDFIVEDLFIPNACVSDRDVPEARRDDSPLYKFLAMNLYAIGFSGVALGIARPMLESFKALTLEKKPWLRTRLLKDEGVVQAEVARAQIRLESARHFVEKEAGEIWNSVVATGELTIADRMRIRLATTHAIHEAKEVADTVYDAAGATAVFHSSAFERRFRDIHTVTQQVQGRKTHYQTVGAFLLGHPPDLAAV